MALKPTPSSRSTLTNHVFPCLYVCYLLRSKKGGTFSNRTYIGSSPDPPRRIRQHNGDLKAGGARKTMMFRPWEMEINVYGFPSKLLALQFEWAWQSPWLSRHLRNENGESYFKKAAGANHFQHKIAVLQRMLVSNPWNGLGLRVRFYSEHAQAVWEEAQRNGPLSRGPPTGRGPKRKTSHEVLASGSQWPDMSKVETVLRVEGVDGARMTREEPKKYGEGDRIERIETDDRTWSVEQWEQWKAVEDKKHKCACCNKAINTTDHLSFTFCPASDCTSTSHIPCLAERYITSESLLPTAGPCPTCKTIANWSQLIRGSFRRKDASEGKYEKKRRKNAKAVSAEEEEDEDMSDKSDEESEPVKPKKRVTKAKAPRKKAAATAAKVKEDEEMSQPATEEESEPVKPIKRSTTAKATKSKSKSRSYSTSSISSIDSEEDPERSMAFDAAAQGSFDAGCLFLPGEDDAYQTPGDSDEQVPDPTSVGSLGFSTVQL